MIKILSFELSVYINNFLLSYLYFNVIFNNAVITLFNFLLCPFNKIIFNFKVKNVNALIEFLFKVFILKI